MEPDSTDTGGTPPASAAPLVVSPTGAPTRPASPVDSMSADDYARAVNDALRPGGAQAPPPPPEASGWQTAAKAVGNWLSGFGQDIRAIYRTTASINNPNAATPADAQRAADAIQGMGSETSKGLAKIGTGLARLTSDVASSDAVAALGSGGVPAFKTLVQPKVNAALDSINQDIDNYYGTSDSPLAQATGQVTSIAAQMLLTPELGMESGAANLWGSLSPKFGEVGPKVLPWIIKKGVPAFETALRFGVGQEATNTNPYAPGLAQMAAASGIPGLDKIAADFTVNPNDPWWMARVKNASVNTITGVAAEAVGHAVMGAWNFGAARLVARGEDALLPKGTFPPGVTSKADKLDHLVSQGLANHEVVQNAVDGTHIESGSVVHAEPTADGGALIRPLHPSEVEPEYAPKAPVGGRPSADAQRFSDALGINPETNMMGGAKVDLRLQGGNTAKLETLESMDTRGQGAGKKALKAITDAADEHGINLTLQASPFGENAMSSEQLRNYYRDAGFRQAGPGSAEMNRAPGAQPELHRELTPGEEPKVPAEAVPVPQKAEADQLVNSANRYAKAAKAGNAGITPEQTQAHLDLAKKILATNDPAERAQIVKQAQLNLNHLSSKDAVRAQFDALTTQFQTELQAARGKSTWDKVLGQVKSLVGSGSPDDVASALREKYKGTDGLSASVLAGDVVKQKMGQDLASLSEALDARPNDPFLLGQAREGLDNFYSFSKEHQAAVSEVGRALNIRKARSLVNTKDFPFATEGGPLAGLATKDANQDVLKLAGQMQRRQSLPRINKVDPFQGKAMAAEYDKLPVNDPAAKPAYDALNSEVEEQYQRLQKAGYKFEFTDKDPYKNSAEMMKDVRENKTLKVFKTSGDQAHPYMTPEQNDKFRAVHDLLAHAGPGNQFGPAGEENAYRLHASTLSDQALPALASETRGQNSWVNFGPNADLPPAQRPFAQQKAAMWPKEYLGDYGNMPGASEHGQTPYITPTMSDNDVRGMLRIIKMSDGAPRDPEMIRDAAELIHKGTGLAKVTEMVVNGILSGPRTLGTIFQSGMMMNAFENSSRYAAGVFTRNPILRQQAADQMFANFSQMKDAIGAGWTAMKEGRSITNPMSVGREIGYTEAGPSKNIVARTTGQVVRMPGNLIQGIDEFLGVLGQRQFIVGRSLQMGREAGLTGNDLASRVADDLRNSYDRKTGVCIVPGAVQYGQNFAFKTPLRGDQWASGVRSFTIDHPESRLIVPVVKTAGNIFDRSWQMTPGLNKLNAGYAAKIAQGGEVAATARTQAGIGAAMWATAMYGVMAGHITGAGPSDPALKKLWLKDNQPYSLKVGDQNYEYKRWEPWSTIIGLAADAHTIYHEMADGKTSDPSDLMYAGTAALAHNLGSKSYLSTMFQLMDAVGSGDASKMKSFMEHMAGEAVPFSSALNTLNPDDTQREVRGMADAMMAKVPGLSTRLDPKFNIFGEPTMKTPGYFNRAFDTWGMSKPSGKNVEDDLLELKGRLNSLPAQNYKGLGLDLTDRSQWENPLLSENRGKSPWIRYNELMRSPMYGLPSFRSKLEDFIKSPRWEESSIGTQQFPGGTRLQEVQALKSSAEEHAMQQVMAEYPKLDQAFRLQLQAKGNALRSTNYQNSVNAQP